MLNPFQILDLYLDWRRKRRTRAGKASGVLLLSCGGLGDMVLFALVLPRLLDLAAGGERVSVLVRSDAAKMTFVFPPRVEVRSVDFERLMKDLGYRRRACDELFDVQYRLVVSCDYLRHPYLDEALVAACAAPETLAMEPRPWAKYDRVLRRNRGLYKRLYDSGPPRLDKVVRWTRFADWLTGETRPPPVVRLPEAGQPLPDQPAVPLLLVQPFSAVREKQSPASLYARIVEALPASRRVVITGTPGDLDRNPEFLPLLELPGVEFDSSTFADLVPLLRAARLVISIDTALMHLAVAVGAPTLCLASAAFVGEIVPYDPAITPSNAHFVYHSMPCEGCLGVCVFPAEDGAFPYVARLDGHAVITKVKELMIP